ncbi:unnamed protein product [Cylicocyclus nassatus]|uniref:SnoaL-like domain-containing protein n=1 Tax=Cylicocyclus nassatus TaxID=53992 RepID=A0AA36H668_CYLNA|nr:unnamed protein product [Cylicocyclus nassatus]
MSHRLHTAIMSSDEAKTIIKPYFDEILKQREAHDFDKAVDLFDPDGVFIDKGKHSAIYGRDALKKEHESYKEKIGKATPTITNDHYYQFGDFISAVFDCELNTDKGAKFKGHVTQIWRKAGDKYFMLHEEFTMNEA